MKLTFQKYESRKHVVKLTFQGTPTTKTQEKLSKTKLFRAAMKKHWNHCKKHVAAAPPSKTYCKIDIFEVGTQRHNVKYSFQQKRLQKHCQNCRFRKRAEKQQKGYLGAHLPDHLGDHLPICAIWISLVKGLIWELSKGILSWGGRRGVGYNPLRASPIKNPNLFNPRWIG